MFCRGSAFGLWPAFLLRLDSLCTWRERGACWDRSDVPVLEEFQLGILSLQLPLFKQAHFFPSPVSITTWPRNGTYKCTVSCSLAAYGQSLLVFQTLPSSCGRACGDGFFQNNSQASIRCITALLRSITQHQNSSRHCWCPLTAPPPPPILWPAVRKKAGPYAHFSFSRLAFSYVWAKNENLRREQLWSGEVDLKFETSQVEKFQLVLQKILRCTGSYWTFAHVSVHSIYLR